MTKVFRITILIILFFTVQSESLLSAAPNDDNTVDVVSKVLDHYYVDFSPVGKVELPRFFYDAEGFHFFGSTTAAINSETFTDEIYLEEDEPEGAKLKPVTYHVVRTDNQPILFDFSITSHLLFFWFSALLTLAIFIPLTRRYKAGQGTKSEPQGAFHNLFETFVVFVRDDIAKPNIGHNYIRFTPYLLTVFFLILFMNLFGLMPWGVSSTADITVTAVLALMTFMITQLSASKDYWKHIFWFPGVPFYIRLILFPVEFIGIFTKPFSLAIRLFANMASGKILIFSILGIIFVFNNLFGSAVAYASSPIWILMTLFVYLIKAFIAFIQAYVFTILSALFIGMAMVEHDEIHETENI
ncbi:MAG: F0F1 ATP synthase subunit A [Balneolales bacterium]